MKDEPPAAPALPESTLGSAASIGLVEIVLGNGRVLRVAERIDPAVLARLAAALDRFAPDIEPALLDVRLEKDRQPIEPLFVGVAVAYEDQVLRFSCGT